MGTQRSTWTGSNTMGLTWLDRIDTATTVTEVLDVVRVYLAHLSPDEISSLPARCRPRKLMDGDDIADYALDLVRETCEDAESTPLALKVASVVSHASSRVSELMAAAHVAAGKTSTA